MTFYEQTTLFFFIWFTVWIILSSFIQTVIQRNKLNELEKRCNELKREFDIQITKTEDLDLIKQYRNSKKIRNRAKQYDLDLKKYCFTFDDETLFFEFEAKKDLDRMTRKRWNERKCKLENWSNKI